MKTSVIAAVLWMMLGVGCAHKAATDAVGFTELNSTETVEMLKNNKDLLILDVRSVKEQTTKHDFLKGATMIPEAELAGRLSEIAAYKDKTVVVACPCGKRSRRGAELLVKNGFEHVYNISEPGIPGLVKVPGAPVEYR